MDIALAILAITLVAVVAYFNFKLREYEIKAINLENMLDTANWEVCELSNALDHYIEQIDELNRDNDAYKIAFYNMREQRNEYMDELWSERVSNNQNTLT